MGGLGLESIAKHPKNRRASLGTRRLRLLGSKISGTGVLKIWITDRLRFFRGLGLVSIAKRPRKRSPDFFDGILQGKIGREFGVGVLNRFREVLPKSGQMKECLRRLKGMVKWLNDPTPHVRGAELLVVGLHEAREIVLTEFTRIF